ncbi:MAG: DNA-methyltransferase [Patescibacteria group bacterium]
MADNSVDLVLTDAPFGVRKDEDWDDKQHFISNANYWLSECLRVSKHAVIWFCASRMIPYIMNGINGKEELLRRIHVYDKPPGTQFAGASNNNIWFSIEPILVFSKDWDKTKSYGKDMPMGYDTFNYRTVSFKTHNHPTSKPVGLIRKLIGYYSAPNEIILDPFGGSGTTAIAAIDMNRRSLLIEQSPLPDKPISDDNPDHYGNAKRRIEKHLSEPKMFTDVVDDLSTEDTENLELFKEIK